MAQVVERILGKDEVASSTLAISSNKNPLTFERIFLFEYTIPQRRTEFKYFI